MSWSDFACKLVEFLEKPNILGAGVLGIILIFLAYITPIGVMTYTSISNTERLEAVAIRNTLELKAAIKDLANSMEKHSLASR